MKRALIVLAFAACGCEAVVGGADPIYVPPDAAADGDAAAPADEEAGPSAICEPCPAGDVACIARCKDASPP